MRFDTEHSKTITQWYWNEPENGMSFEDCEVIFRETIRRFRQIEKGRRKLLPDNKLTT